MKKDIKEEITQLALKYIDGIENGKLSRSHAAHKKLSLICKQKCATEDQGNAFFSDLITHEEPAVRLLAATYLYITDHERGIAEFQKLKELRISHISLLASSNLWWIKQGLFQIDLD